MNKYAKKSWLKLNAYRRKQLAKLRKGKKVTKKAWYNAVKDFNILGSRGKVKKRTAKRTAY
jgi:hypothetical protein